MKDEMTGLYNNHGFRMLSEELLERMENTDTSIAFFVFDLDNLKEINNSYGHGEGNFAIRILGQALENAIEKNDICARIDGDGFYVLTTNYTKDNALTLIHLVNRYLNNYNKLHTKKYQLSVSYGFALDNMNPSFDLDELFEKAEREMFLQKKEKSSQHSQTSKPL